MNTFYVAWTEADGKRSRFGAAYTRAMAERLAEHFNRDLSLPATHVAVPAGRIDAWMAKVPGAFVVAWTERDGARAHFSDACPEDAARRIVDHLNNGSSFPATHVAVPADRIAEWKAGTWMMS